MITAAFEGRFLRLSVEGTAEEFLVRPLPRKRARALAAAFSAAARDAAGSAGFQALVAEAIGADSYARITGDHVQEFDELGFYVRTALPGAVMVEPAEDLLPPGPEQRFRVVPAPWDGADLRAEEVDALGLAALLWHTVGGEAVRSFLSATEGRGRVASTWA